MHPTLIELNGIGLHTWGLMVLTAFLVACLVTGMRAAKVGIDPDKLVGFYFTLIAVSLPGARLYHFLLAEPERLLENPLVFFDIKAGGFAFLGGVIGGAAGGIGYALLARIPVWKLVDVAAPSIMLGYAIGRIGCFFAGCCHGATCGLPIARVLVNFDGGQLVTVEGFPWLAHVYTRGVGVGSVFSVPVYPTQLWEMGIALLLFAVLSWMWRYARYFDGQVMVALLALYPVARFITEGFRGDTIRGLHEVGPWELSSSQLVAGVLILVDLVIIALRASKGVAPEARFVPPEDER